MNQKILISVLILLVAILGGTTVYLLTAQKSVAPIVPTPAPVSKTVPVTEKASPVAQDETAGWKTYTNDLHQFSVNYPNTWPVKESASGDCNKDTYFCEIDFGNISTTPGADRSSVVSILIHSPKGLAEGKKGGSNQGDGFDPCSNFQKVTIASGLQAERKQCAGMDGTFDIFSIDKNGTKYQVTHHTGSASAEANSVFEKIANSFQFTK